ncbi:MAG: DUF6261 family protein [Desulfobulbaceae bacterium]|jgi:hypothetical protein|nr:DUF6261 family protein [Desulfobulbaceae bacterium]
MTNTLTRVKTATLPNEQHFQFMTENLALYHAHDPAALGIDAFMAEFEAALADESLALNAVRKSAATARIAKADQTFNLAFSGMSQYAEACLKHYDPAVRLAAENLAVVFAAFGNVSRLPYREELGAVTNLLEALRQRAEDYAVVALAPWAEAVEQAARDLSALLDERVGEQAGRTELRVRETRRALDAVFKTVTGRLEAMLNLHGDALAGNFRPAYNAHAAEYKLKLAQHAGRLKQDPPATDTATAE